MSETTKYKLTHKTTGEEVVARPVVFGDNYVTFETEVEGVRIDFNNPNKSGELSNAVWDIEEIKSSKKEDKPAK